MQPFPDASFVGCSQPLPTGILCAAHGGVTQREDYIKWYQARVLTQCCVQMEREHREEVERLERQLVAERAAATEASRDAAAFAQDLAQVAQIMLQRKDYGAVNLGLYPRFGMCKAQVSNLRSQIPRVTLWKLKGSNVRENAIGRLMICAM